MGTTGTCVIVHLALLLLTTSFQLTHAVVCNSASQGYQDIAFTSAKRTDAIQVESPPGYNPQSGQYDTNQDICYRVKYSPASPSTIPLATGESLAIRAQMRIDLDRVDSGSYAYCQDTMQITYTTLRGQSNTTTYCSTPWYAGLITTASAGFSARYNTDSTQRGGNGYRILFSPVVIPSSGSKSGEITSAFTGCTPIALTSADVDFVWTSQYYPLSIQLTEECWVFYMESNINETEYFIQIQVLTLNGDSKSWLSLYETSNGKSTTNLFGYAAGTERKDYKGKNYTACGTTVKLSYTKDDYTLGLSSFIIVEGVMGLARLVPKANNKCGVSNLNIAAIITGGIAGGIVAVVVAVVVMMCIIQANKKPKRQVSPTGVSSGVSYPVQNTGFSNVPPLAANGQISTTYSTQAAYGLSTQPQPAYGQPAYGQPAYGQPAYGQPAYAQPTNGQPAYGVSTQSQPAYGVPTQKQPAYGVPTHPPPAYGQAMTSQYGAPPATNPAYDANTVPSAPVYLPPIAPTTYRNDDVF